MKIALITAWDEKYENLAMLTTPLMHLYCLRNGYHFAPFRGGFHLDLEKDPSLLTYGDRGKIQHYKNLYDQYDVIAWLDVDTVITNMNRRLEDILGDRPFLWTYGPAGPLSGFTIARTIPEVHLALHAVMHRAAEDASPQAIGGRSDQDTMRFFMNTPPFDWVFKNCVSCKDAGHCMPFSVFGWERYAYLGDWEPGDFLYTIPSLPIDTRYTLLADKIAEVYANA